MDEMAIRSGVHFNCQRLQGYISYGHKINDSDSMIEATEALVFFNCCFKFSLENSSWLFFNSRVNC